LLSQIAIARINTKTLSEPQITTDEDDFADKYISGFICITAGLHHCELRRIETLSEPQITTDEDDFADKDISGFICITAGLHHCELRRIKTLSESPIVAR
jgi:hypothetical protein